jgi:hypothetical protein
MREFNRTTPKAIKQSQNMHKTITMAPSQARKAADKSRLRANRDVLFAK